MTTFIIAGVASTTTTAISQASQGAAASQCGGASWYSMGSKTASGERMSSAVLAAAHRSLPFGTHVKVQNLGNGRAVVVRINDRGPFVRGRVIDVTKAAAQQLGFIGNGIARVKLTVVDGQGRLYGNCT